MKVITLINEKGGVGKTTLSIHLASSLAIRGARVVLIDADPQSHSTTMMGLNKRGGLYRLIVQEAEWREVLALPPVENWAGPYKDNVGTLAVLPSNTETYGIPVACDPTLRLKERIAELEKYIDFVVIDTPPTQSGLQSMVYVASTHLIYPSQCQSLSLDGLAETVGRMTQLNKARAMYGIEPVTLIGVAPTMYQDRTSAHQHGLNLIKKHFGENGVLPAISQSTVWRDREYARQSIFAYAPESKAAAEMETFTDEVLKRMGITTTA